MKHLKQKKIHFIGIGGIGASSLAQILKNKGKEVSGSDQTASEITKSLKLSGINVKTKHDPKNIPKECELIIYSPAIPKNNVELLEAENRGLQVLSYPEALGELTKDYYTIAVTGTHGKSTTTAIISLILEKADIDPTVVIGTKVPQFNNKNYRIGESNYLVIEACEYKESFLNFDPNIIVITNLEADHLDYYKNLENYKKSFSKFCKLAPEDGSIIICSDEKNLKDIVKCADAQIIEWSEKQNKEIILKGNTLKFISKVDDDHLSDDLKIQPSIPGKINIENAVNAAIVGMTLNIDSQTIESAIKDFKGTWRRMETKETKMKGTIFIDDYAHHPTEIKRTLEALREKYPNQKILCIFQPHQYSRTHLLLEEFGRSFNLADKIIIPDIYEVRDTKKDKEKVNAEDLVAEINKHHPKATYGKGLMKTAEYIKKNYNKYDLIITMGAGNIHDIYKAL